MNDRAKVTTIVEVPELPKNLRMDPAPKGEELPRSERPTEKMQVRHG